MPDKLRKAALALIALAALALGGSALADAASNGNNSSSPQSQRPPMAPDPLSSEDAAKVEAAALEEVPGATVERTEAGGPYPTPYHAHITTEGGTRRVVLVNSDFEATGVQADRMRGRPGRGGPPPGFGPCADDRP